MGFDIGSLLSGLFTGATDIAGAKIQADMQQQVAQEQMNFQRDMSNTAWQRGVKDMKAAGINPLLSFSQGPASSPPGAMAQVPNILGGAVSSALQAVLAKSQIENVATDTAKKWMEARKTDQERANITASPASEAPLGPRWTPFAVQLMEAQRDNIASAAALNRANLPAATITGSKAGGVMKLLTGGVSAAKMAAQAIGEF
jgi:hypothetical protein